MRASIRFIGTLCLAAMVASCGGGGGDDKPAGNSGTSDSIGGVVVVEPPVVVPPLRFEAGALLANVAIGSSATVTVNAVSADDAFDGSPVYVTVLEGSGVLSYGMEVAAVDARTVAVTMHTLPVLAQGHHQGSLLLHLCKDPACVTPHVGSPVSLPYDITVANGALQAHAIYATAMSVHRGETLDRQVTVVVEGAEPAVGWTAIPMQPWLTVVGGSGSGRGTFRVGFQSVDLAEGRHAGEVIVRAANGQSSRVALQLDVLPASFAVTSEQPSFTAINGAPIPAQTISFQLNNKASKPWTAVSNEPWLQLGTLQGSTPATLTVQPDPSRGKLPSGVHLADVILSSEGVADMLLTTQLRLMPATLSSSDLVVTLGGDKGRDWLTAKSLRLSLNTGTNGWPFTVGNLPDWLSTSASGGMVSESGTPVDLLLRPENLTSGSRSANVKLSAQVNGDAPSVAVTVNANVDQRRLLPSEWGVAMSSSPTGTALTRTLKIRDNFGGALAWRASSSAAWLQVSGNGDTSGESRLVLTADPSALPLETLSYASVTVSTATGNVEPAVIRVALWRSATGLPDVVKVPISGEFNPIAPDKIRPYLYVRTSTAIDVIHAYTGAKIGSIVGMGGGYPMSVSPDGSRLYALGSNSVLVADLDSLTKLDTWVSDKKIDWQSHLVATRVNGVDVVLVSTEGMSGQALARGRSLPGQFGFYGPLTASLDGSLAYSFGGRRELDFAEISGGMLFVPQTFGPSYGANNQDDIALSDSGTHVYVASSGWPQQGDYCRAFDAQTGASLGVLATDNERATSVEVTRDGRVLCGITPFSGTAFAFRLYKSDGSLLKTYMLGTGRNVLLQGKLAVSPDGFVAGAHMSDGHLHLVPIGAP